MELKDRPAGNRIVSLDRMRGFSLLGIFLVNMISLHSPFFYIDPETWWDGELNRWTYLFIDLFVQASFYPLFAMLFGYGLVILRERTLERNLSFYPLALRRLSILLAIGILHAFLIWHGDILITYAVTGFVFLLFIRLSAKKLLITGLILYIVPNLLLLFMLGAASIVDGSGEFSMYDKEAAGKSILAYQSGSFSEVTAQRFSDWYKNNNPGSLIFYLITILPLFLIGAGTAKMQLFEDIQSKKRKIVFSGVALAFSGLLLKAYPYLSSKTIMADYAQDIFGGAMLAAAYALLIALASEYKMFDWFFAPLEAAGRLSISNYLFQSTVSSMIFYSYGLGFYGKVSIFTGTMLATGIYIFQLAVSRWWVGKFYYGPVEWLWRSATYMKMQRFIRGNRS